MLKICSPGSTHILYHNHLQVLLYAGDVERHGTSL
jgi:hypothetical protein